VARTTLRSKGQLTLPDDIRRAAHLEAGDLLEAELTADGILLRPLTALLQRWAHRSIRTTLPSNSCDSARRQHLVTGIRTKLVIRPPA